MEADSEPTYIEDFWGLGESSLILIEKEIDDLLNKAKENDHARRSDIVKS